GERNWGQMLFALGSGNSHQEYQTRPMWIPGNTAAHMTAKMVMASAARLIEVRQRWRRRNRMAEMSVPAWPMPIHQTKLTMAQPQPIGMLMPQMPVPLTTSQVIATVINPMRLKAIAKPTNQPKEVE